MAIPRYRPAVINAPVTLAPVRPAYRSHAKPQGPVFIPSQQQSDFFDWVLDGTGSCLLEAVAGAGKTTTLIQALGRMSGQIFFGAYNKDIATEIKQKAAAAGVAGPNVFITTMHGYGMTNWTRGNKDVQVDDRKVAKLIDKAAEADPAFDQARVFISKLVSFGKQYIFGCKGKPPISSIDHWERLALHFGLDVDLPGSELEEGGMRIEDAIAMVQVIYQQSANQCQKVVDFDDMIFAPLYFNTMLFKNDWVLLDERQDTNPARRELAKRMLKPRGRFIGVGDTHQAIYGFTGADGGTENFVKDFGCIQMPLTVTYRCPKAVVAYVQQWVSHIQAHPDAPEGMVRAPLKDAPVEGQPIRPWFLVDQPTAQDAILCRYTKPLVQTAFAMIRQGVACRVLGRDIGRGLEVLATRWNITSLDKLEEKLEALQAHEAAKPGQSDKKIQELQDKIDTLRVFIDRARAQGKRLIADVVADIKTLFADDTTGCVVLSTIHKAKGREWPRVYWLQASQRMKALKDWEAAQENNLKYVAGTRAQAELILVPEGVA